MIACLNHWNDSVQQLFDRKDIKINEKNNAGKVPFDFVWQDGKQKRFLGHPGLHIVSAFRNMLKYCDFTQEDKHNEIAARINRNIDAIKYPHHLLDLAKAIGIGNGNAPGIDDTLSKLRYRQEYHCAFLKKNFGYRETNDSEEIARKIIERAKDILEKNHYQVKDQAEYAIYLNLFDRQITRYDETKDKQARQDLILWLKESAILPREEFIEYKKAYF